MTSIAVWVHTVRPVTGEPYEEACAIADTRITVRDTAISDSIAKILPLTLRYRLRQSDGTFGAPFAESRVGLCFAGYVELVAEVYFAAVNMLMSVGVDDAGLADGGPDLGAVARVVRKLLNDAAARLVARRGLSFRGANFPAVDIVLFGQLPSSGASEVWHVKSRASTENFGRARVRVQVLDRAEPLFLGTGAARHRRRWEAIIARGLGLGGDTPLRALGAMIRRLEDVTVGGSTQIVTCRRGVYTPYQTELDRSRGPAYLGVRLDAFDENIGGLAAGCIAMDTVVAHGRQSASAAYDPKF